MTEAAPVAARRLSKSSLLSLICGILGCVPFVTGILAVLLGIVGFVRTSNPLKKGRWMAVVGILLGVMSIGGWTLFGGGIWAIFKATEGPRVATHNLIKELAENDMAEAKTFAPRISDVQLEAVGEYVRKQGKFIDTTFANTSIEEGGSGHVEGTVKFDTGTQKVKADLDSTKDGWKVTSIEIVP